MTIDNQNEEFSQERPDQRSLSIGGNVDNSPIVVGDRNTIHQGPTSYYTTNVFSPVNVAPVPSVPSQPLSKQEYRWRQVLVDNVKHYWIEGVLEKSLHNQALIELGLEERSKAVTSPLSGIGEFPDEPSRAFPEGTQATEIFDGLGAGRTLLILGEPGAGKTTTLLKLAQSLLERIGDDLSQPIPVILNLSSWAKKRQPIAEWLVQDLYETFQVSKALGKTWIKEEQLVLCLDGLDEVEAKHRNACVEALNQFIQEHGRTEMVVCSRINAYEALTERLRVRCAIYAQPLTLSQIDRYIDQAGEQLAALRTVFSRALEIKKLATSPLVLSIMSLAYKGYSAGMVPDIISDEKFRQRLLDIYIERMFQRRGKKHNCTDEQAKYWLSWMAQRMIQTSQTVFFIESMQPSWLQTRRQRLRYRIESALFFLLSFSLIDGFISWLISELIYVLTDDPRVLPTYGLLVNELTGGLIFGLIAGLTALTLSEITPTGTLKWSAKTAKKSFYIGLLYGFVIVPLASLLLDFVNGLITGRRFDSINVSVDMLINGFVLGLIGGLIGGSISGLIGGFRGSTIDDKVKPNHGIWKSAQNAGIFTLISWLIIGLLIGVPTGVLSGRTDGTFFGQTAGLLYGLSMGLSIGLTIGLLCGLIGGGSACLRHFSLRVRLYRMSYTPWNYARFLDYATERLFLQKVGGGYIFVHRMLLEHFAQMELGGKG